MVELTTETTGIAVALTKTIDCAAFCVTEVQARDEGTRYALRVERAELGTDYAGIGERLAELNEQLVEAVDRANKTRRKPLGLPRIVVGVGSLGAPFVDSFFLNLGARGVHPSQIAAVLIADDKREAYVPDGCLVLHISKAALIRRFVVLIGNGRVGIAKSSAVEELTHQMRAVRRRITPTKATSYSVLESERDDLVIAAALSLWELKGGRE